MEGEDLLLCTTCGTQFDIPATEPPSGYCRICNDPRQYIPKDGQQWTSLKAESGKHETKWAQDEKDDRIWSIWAEPKLGIGQRAIILKTDHGNIMWDCIAYLDPPLIDFIKSIGGLEAIVISHPHFYTTHLTWSETFSCPIYMHSADAEWLNRKDTDDRRRLLTEDTTEIVTGVTAVRVGGHFDGSMVLHWEDHLFIADTFMIVPAGFHRKDRLEGMTSFSFMWSIPNMIPLSPDIILDMWKRIEPFDFAVTHGLFHGFDIRDVDVKKSVLESMKIQVRKQGFEVHPLLEQTCA